MPKSSRNTRAQVYEDAGTPESDDDELLEFARPANHTVCGGRSSRRREEVRTDGVAGFARTSSATYRPISPLRIAYTESPGRSRRAPPREACGGNKFLKCMGVAPVLLAMLFGIGAAVISSFLYIDSGTLCSHGTCFSMGFWRVQHLNTILDVITGAATNFPVGTCEALQQIPTSDSDGTFIGTIEQSYATQAFEPNCSVASTNTDVLNCINMCRQEYKVAYDAETRRFSVVSVMNATLTNGFPCFAECSAMGFGTADEAGPVTVRFDLHSNLQNDLVYQLTFIHNATAGTIASNFSATGGNTSAVHCNSGDYIVTGGTVLGVTAGVPSGADNGDDDGGDDVVITATCQSGLVARCYAGRGLGTIGTVAAAVATLCGTRWALGTGQWKNYRCFIAFASLALACFSVTFSFVISYVHGIGGDVAMGCALPSYFQQFDLKYGESFALYVAASVFLLLSILVSVLC